MEQAAQVATHHRSRAQIAADHVTGWIFPARTQNLLASRDTLPNVAVLV